MQVIRDAQAFGEPPNRRHAAARGAKEEDKGSWHSKRGKGHGRDLRSVLQPMRVYIRGNMLVVGDVLTQ